MERWVYDSDSGRPGRRRGLFVWLLDAAFAVVTALVSRDEVQRAESRAFVERNFSGSLPGFLTAFVGGRGLSAEEAEELRRMIAAFEEKRDE